jgi:hypothetical protein
MDLSINMQNTANSSPSATSLTNWVTKLVRDQYMIFSQKIEHSTTFCQSDGGQKRQEARIFTTFDEQDKSKGKDGSVCSFLADLTYTGKSSDNIAAGMNQLLKKFGHPDNQVSGTTSNLGAGMPKSFAKSCEQLTIWYVRGMIDSTPALQPFRAFRASHSPTKR